MSLVCQKGLTVGGRYELVRLLGEGGMGEVWAAVHRVTRKPVALKVLKGEGRPEERRRFLREARAATAVRHPAVVPIHDILEERGTPILVMDLLSGQTLATYLVGRGPLPLGAVAAIITPVISAVGTAHALGIVHRDLKPDNIFITDQIDGHLEVKVLDFGVAKLTATEGDAAQTGGLTRTGEILGTPYYMSPEQVFGEHDVDHRADIWSLGVILYECLAGARPFEGDNVGQILKKVMISGTAPLADVAPNVPKAITDLVGRMISVDRAARPQDLREVLELLRQHTDRSVLSFGTAQPRQVIAPTNERTDPFSKTTGAAASEPRRNAGPWILVGMLSLALIGSGIAWYVKRSHLPPANPAPINAAPQNPAPPIIAAPQNPPPPINAAPQNPTPPIIAAPQNPPPATPGKKPAGGKHKRPAAPPTKHPEKLPGGVTDEVPF